MPTWMVAAKGGRLAHGSPRRCGVTPSALVRREAQVLLASLAFLGSILNFVKVFPARRLERWDCERVFPSTGWASWLVGLRLLERRRATCLIFKNDRGQPKEPKVVIWAFPNSATPNRLDSIACISIAIMATEKKRDVRPFRTRASLRYSIGPRPPRNGRERNPTNTMFLLSPEKQIEVCPNRVFALELVKCNALLWRGPFLSLLRRA